MTAAESNPRAMSYGYDKLRVIKPGFIGETVLVCEHLLIVERKTPVT